MSTGERLAAARSTKTRLFRAPGRVNIIGEHTDYNNGLVLPTNTALYTWLSVSQRQDRRVHVVANNLADTRFFDLDDLTRSDDPCWIDYIKGVAWYLENEGSRLRGADISIHGDLPIGGGLSSSASLELAVAVALLDIAGETLPSKRIAALCQSAERDFAGVNCGIMDQYSIACGQYGKAMLLDCRSMDTEFVNIPDGLAMLITDSGVKHKLPDSGYNDRAEECSQSVRLLRGADKNIESLRDVSIGFLETQKERLGDTYYRRSRHVVTEIQRTMDATNALRSADTERLGTLVSASHASLRDDFEVSCEEVETLVAIANQCNGVLGSRIVGAGFGGCVLSIVEAAKIDDVARKVSKGYGAVIGREPWCHRVTATQSAMEILDA